MKPNGKSTSAFTLIEIMIVVAIIGMLAAIAVPNLLKAISEARQKVCIANLRQIEGAKMRWALAQQKDASATPTDADLFGINAPIRDKPQCPSGGTYTLNPVEEKPTCSVPGHTY